MNTLLLDRSTWDLCLDSSGNIATASNPYSLAQDAASEIRTFAGEVYYDTTKGIPYFAQVLGYLPPLSLLKALFIDAALNVPETQSATCFVSAINPATRQLTGQVQVTPESGAGIAASTFTAGA